jgi:hypothetical protein
MRLVETALLAEMFCCSIKLRLFADLMLPEGFKFCFFSFKRILDGFCCGFAWNFFCGFGIKLIYRLAPFLVVARELW